MTENVRIPAVLADYGCGRTMVCCRSPWRANLLEGEAEELEDLLSLSHPVLAARWRQAVVRHGGVDVVRQPGGRCALLAESSRACELHADAGLAALPSACRNFPRSVTATPVGWEVAMHLSCPTAAGMVASAPQPFRWVEIPQEDWHYPPMHTVGARLAASRAADLGFADLEALRAGWWRRLADDGDLAATLLALHDAPLEPHARSASTLGCFTAVPDMAALRAMTTVLTTLPGATPDEGRTRAWWTALGQPWSPAELAEALNAVRPVAACLAGLDVQQAGVHATGTVAGHLHEVGQRVVRMAQVAAVLRERPATTADLAVRDALVAVARLAGLAVAGQIQTF